MNFAQASSFCQNLGGGNLASIHSGGEQAFLAEFVGADSISWVGYSKSLGSSFGWTDGTLVDYLGGRSSTFDVNSTSISPSFDTCQSNL